MRVPPDSRLLQRRACLVGGAALALVATGLAGCSSSTERAQSYDNNEWLQSGANRIANLALRDNVQSVKRVQLSLYRRNPREWRKWCASADEAIQRTWTSISDNQPLPQLHGAYGVDAIRLAFETTPKPFEGDRVAALVVGWAALLKQANGDTWEQNMLDGVSAENSYRAARNFEISLWLISSKTGPDGQPLLLATEISERGRNLLVDRELSKVVARLDLLAAQADEKYRRAAMDFGRTGFLAASGRSLRWCRSSRDCCARALTLSRVGLALRRNRGRQLVGRSRGVCRWAAMRRFHARSDALGWHPGATHWPLTVAVDVAVAVDRDGTALPLFDPAQRPGAAWLGLWGGGDFRGGEERNLWAGACEARASILTRRGCLNGVHRRGTQ